MQRTWAVLLATIALAVSTAFTPVPLRYPVLTRSQEKSTNARYVMSVWQRDSLQLVLKYVPQERLLLGTGMK